MIFTFPSALRNVSRNLISCLPSTPLSLRMSPLFLPTHGYSCHRVSLHQPDSAGFEIATLLRITPYMARIIRIVTSSMPFGTGGTYTGTSLTRPKTLQITFRCHSILHQLY